MVGPKKFRYPLFGHINIPVSVDQIDVTKDKIVIN